VSKTFEQWMKEVDRVLQRRGFGSSEGCFDFGWFEYYRDKETAEDAVEDAIEYWKELM
jgi:hypothetical protein